MIVHGGFKASLINTKTLRPQSVFGQIIWEAVRIIKLERRVAGQNIARGHAGCCFVQKLDALVERATELRLFLLQCRFNQRLRAKQFRISCSHFGGKAAHQTVHQWLFRTKNMGVAHGASHDTPQDITATFVGWHHAIGQQEAGGTQMVGNHPVAGLLRAFGLCAGQLFRSVDQRLEGIGVVIVRNALHDSSNTLKPHAGIDRGLWQWHIGAIFLPFELHEHEVPDFDKPVTIFIGASRRSAKNMVAMVVEYFAARTARTGITHRPEVIIR